MNFIISYVERGSPLYFIRKISKHSFKTFEISSKTKEEKTEKTLCHLFQHFSRLSCRSNTDNDQAIRDDYFKQHKPLTICEV